MRRSKGLAAIWTILITVLIMVGLGAGGYFYLNAKQAKDKDSLSKQITSLTKDLDALKASSATGASTVTSGSSAVSSNLSTYTSTKYGYTLEYPKTFSLVDWMWDGLNNRRSPQEGKVVWIDKVAIGEKAIVMDSDPRARYFSLWVSDEACTATSFGTEGVTVTNSTLSGVSGWKAVVTDNTNIMGGDFTTTYAANHGTKCYYLQIVNSDAAGTHDAAIDAIVASFKFAS